MGEHTSAAKKGSPPPLVFWFPPPRPPVVATATKQLLYSLQRAGEAAWNRLRIQFNEQQHHYYYKGPPRHPLEVLGDLGEEMPSTLHFRDPGKSQLHLQVRGVGGWVKQRAERIE